MKKSLILLVTAVVVFCFSVSARADAVGLDMPRPSEGDKVYVFTLTDRTHKGELSATPWEGALEILVWGSEMDGAAMTMNIMLQVNGESENASQAISGPDGIKLDNKPGTEKAWLLHIEGTDVFDGRNLPIELPYVKNDWAPIYAGLALEDFGSWDEFAAAIEEGSVYFTAHVQSLGEENESINLGYFSYTGVEDGGTVGIYGDDDPPTHTPEPATMLILGLGMVGFAASRCRRKR